MRKGQLVENYDEKKNTKKTKNKNLNRTRSKSRKRKQQILQNEYEDGLSPLCSSHSNSNTERLNMGKPFYHTQYVQDLSTTSNSADEKKKKRRSRDKNKQSNVEKEYEIRKMAGITYSVPKIKMQYDHRDTSVNENGAKTTKDSLLSTARILVLAKLDQLIWMQTIEENERHAGRL